MKRLSLLFILLTPFILKAQDIEKHYKVYDVKKKKLIMLDYIVSDMAAANVLFFG